MSKGNIALIRKISLKYKQTTIDLPFEEDDTLGMGFADIDEAADDWCCFLFGIR